MSPCYVEYDYDRIQRDCASAQVAGKHPVLVLTDADLRPGKTDIQDVTSFRRCQDFRHFDLVVHTKDGVRTCLKDRYRDPPRDPGLFVDYEGRFKK
jgi:hypothetical protein